MLSPDSYREKKISCDPGKFYRSKQNLNSGFMVEVFKTNVQSIHKAKLIIQRLAEEFPKHKINFDLGDCDKILRIEGKKISAEKIISLMEKQKHLCEVLQ